MHTSVIQRTHMHYRHARKCYNTAKFWLWRILALGAARHGITFQQQNVMRENRGFDRTGDKHSRPVDYDALAVTYICRPLPNLQQTNSGILAGQISFHIAAFIFSSNRYKVFSSLFSPRCQILSSSTLFWSLGIGALLFLLFLSTCNTCRY